jgi:cytochrome P450
LPVVVDGLSQEDVTRVLRDQRLKIGVLLDTAATPDTFWGRLRESWIQIRAGLVVRRELRGRAKGRRPRRLDLTDPMVDLLPELGMDRAVHAVTGVLTAIAGPPGAAATCLLYALTLFPDWTERLTDELTTIVPEDLYAAPTHVAPLTLRFVKETLRMWSPIPLVSRPVRKEIDHEKVCLHAGQSYLLSPDILHHDPAHWKNPGIFDPDRWLHPPAQGQEAGSGACFAPFGWSPRSCIGASLGTAQLILLCHLLCTRYEARLFKPEAVRMSMPSIHMPRDFQGTITRR